MSLTVQYGPGLLLRDSATGKISQLIVNYDTGIAAWYVANWDDATTFAATVANGSIRGFQVRYVKVESVSGTITWYVSGDGVGWVPLDTHAAFGDFDQIGFGSTNNAATGNTYVGLSFLRIR